MIKHPFLFLFTTLILISSSAFAAVDEEVSGDDGANNGLVEVHYDAEILAPYRERRGNWSGVFGVNLEQVLPDKFVSAIDGSTYEQLWGEKPVSLIQLEAGTKYNFAIGSLGVGLIYGTGSVTQSTDKLTLTKTAMSFTYTMDALFSDPYIAPYANFQVLQWGILDEGATTSHSEKTSMSTGYSLGLLILMDWLDPDSALNAINSSGLENSYLDIFMTQYNTSEGDETEADLKTTFNYGVGMKLEF